jgi:hypothetical protein
MRSGIVRSAPPVPTNTDVKTIDIKTDPEGAEIYLDSELQWKPTNSMNIQFAKNGQTYVSHSIVLRLASENKSSGNVPIKYEDSSVSYRFKDGFLEVK